MSLGVLNNIAAIYAQNSLNSTQASLQTTLQQLSSGSRINSGADDAAGLAVSDGLNANIAALSQSTANATDSIGLLQTADGALSQVTSLLDRATTLSTEAANGTLNSNQVSSANQEYQNILSEIGNIGSTTNFNSNSVFSNTASTVFVSDGTSSGANVYKDETGALTTASVGQSTATGVATTITGASVTTGSASAAAVSTLTFGSLTDTAAGTLTLQYPTGTTTSVTIASGTTVSSLATQINSALATNGVTGLTATVGTGANSDVLTLTGTTGAANILTLGGTTKTVAPPAAGASPGAGTDFTAASVSTLTAATAQTVLTTVTTAIANVAYQRGVIGADINELTAASNVASAESTNLTSAQSSIDSTNYGQATSNLAKYQVLSQTGISALAQANTVQQEVLKLLQ
jgi:flagellin